MTTSTTWLSRLSEADLLSLIPTSALAHLDEPDEAADIVIRDYSAGLDSRRQLRRGGGKHDKDPTLSPSTWTQLKTEFHRLLCTDDPAYKDVRSRLASAGTSVTILSVALVAQALGDTLGLVCGPLVTLVAVLVYGALRVGQRAFCASLASDTTS